MRRKLILRIVLSYLSLVLIFTSIQAIIVIYLVNYLRKPGSLVTFIGVFILLSAILSVLIGLRAAKHLAEPLHKINLMTKKVAQGELDQKLYLATGENELDELAENLNTMTAQFKKRLRELSSEKTKIENTLKNIADGVIVTDASGEIIMFNPVAAKIFRLGKKVPKGKSMIELTRSYPLDKMVSQTLRGRRIDQELKLTLPKERILRIKVNPLKSGKRKIFGTITVIEDITKLRKLEKVRRDFIANVSHELRTPISAIKALSEALANGAEDDRKVRTKFLRGIQEEIERLSLLVRDILDLSRLESKKDILELEKISLSKVVSQAVKEFEVQAKRNKIEIKTKIPSDLPLIEGDSEQILKALSNLVDNALKYNTSGGKVEVEILDDDSSCQIIIKDTGIGIPQKDLPRIFERFYRVDKDRSRSSGGTGLGLSIVKHVAENHGGKVEVESVLHKGSKFTLTLSKEK